MAGLLLGFLLRFAGILRTIADISQANTQKLRINQWTKAQSCWSLEASQAASKERSAKKRPLPRRALNAPRGPEAPGIPKVASASRCSGGCFAASLPSLARGLGEAEPLPHTDTKALERIFFSRHCKTSPELRMPQEVEIARIAQATLRPIKVSERMVPVEGCTHHWRKKASARGSAPTCGELLEKVSRN